MSKGSRARPLSVPQETFAQRWERTFGAGCGSADLAVKPWDDPLRCASHNTHGERCDYDAGHSGDHGCDTGVAGFGTANFYPWRHVRWADPETKEEP